MGNTDKDPGIAAGADFWAETWVTDLGIAIKATTIDISSTTGNDITILEATESLSGVMSDVDKTKLNDLPNTWLTGTSYAQTEIVSHNGRIYRSLVASNMGNIPAAFGGNGFWAETWVTNLSSPASRSDDSVVIESSAGDSVTVLEATQSFAGVMSNVDKTKLDAAPNLWVADTAYAHEDIVAFGGKFYVALHDVPAVNDGNPVTDTFNWDQLGDEAIGEWRPNKTYKKYDILSYSGQLFYTLTGGSIPFPLPNDGGEPEIIPLEVQGTYISSYVYYEGQVISYFGSLFRRNSTGYQTLNSNSNISEWDPTVTYNNSSFFNLVYFERTLYEVIDFDTLAPTLGLNPNEDPAWEIGFFGTNLTQQNGDSHWDRLSHQPWRRDITYAVGEVVTDNNREYRAIVESTDVITSTATSWAEVSGGINQFSTDNPYVAGDIVWLAADDKIYRNKTGTVVTDPATAFDSDEWEELSKAIASDWDGNKAYITNNLVLSNGDLFRAVADSAEAFVSDRTYALDNVVSQGGTLFRWTTASGSTTDDPTTDIDNGNTDWAVFTSTSTPENDTKFEQVGGKGVPSYNENITYSLGDLVYFSNSIYGSIYRLIKTASAGVAPVTDSNNWADILISIDNPKVTSTTEVVAVAGVTADFFPGNFYNLNNQVRHANAYYHLTDSYSVPWVFQKNYTEIGEVVSSGNRVWQVIAAGVGTSGVRASTITLAFKGEYQVGVSSNLEDNIYIDRIADELYDGNEIDPADDETRHGIVLGSSIGASFADITEVGNYLHFSLGQGRRSAEDVVDTFVNIANLSSFVDSDGNNIDAVVYTENGTWAKVLGEDGVVFAVWTQTVASQLTNENFIVHNRIRTHFDQEPNGYTPEAGSTFFNNTSRILQFKIKNTNLDTDPKFAIGQVIGGSNSDISTYIAPAQPDWYGTIRYNSRVGGVSNERLVEVNIHYSNGNVTNTNFLFIPVEQITDLTVKNGTLGVANDEPPELNPYNSAQEKLFKLYREFPMPQWQIIKGVDLVEGLNLNGLSLEAITTAETVLDSVDLTSVTPTIFDSTSSYVKGNVVSHDTSSDDTTSPVIYSAIADVTMGAFDSDEWTALSADSYSRSQADTLFSGGGGGSAGITTFQVSENSVGTGNPYTKLFINKVYGPRQENPHTIQLLFNNVIYLNNGNRTIRFVFPNSYSRNTGIRVGEVNRMDMANVNNTLLDAAMNLSSAITQGEIVSEW